MYRISAETLLKAINEIPEPPRLFRMDIDVKVNPLLPENWIMVSKSVAEALEEAIKKAKDKAGVVG